jgi:hypothetical protein
MNCPVCHKAMTKNYVDESNNPKNGQRYERTYYVCKKDDVWINTELPKDKPSPATIVYTNWRNETSERHIIPLRVWFGSTKWHKEGQWLLTALDVDKQAERDFALKDIQKWT